MDLLPFQKSFKTLPITLVVLLLVACDNHTGQPVNSVSSKQQNPSTNASNTGRSLAQSEKEQLLDRIQNLETRLVDANAYKPKLDSSLEEIRALQGQLKEAEKQTAPSTSIDKLETPNNDSLIALTNENQQLRDSLSELKQDFQDLDLKYQQSHQEIELLHRELTSNQQTINSFNKKKTN